jgi:hypothetical protein
MAANEFARHARTNTSLSCFRMRTSTTTQKVGNHEAQVAGERIYSANLCIRRRYSGKRVRTVSYFVKRNGHSAARLVSRRRSFQLIHRFLSACLLTRLMHAVYKGFGKADLGRNHGLSGHIYPNELRSTFRHPLPSPILILLDTGRISKKKKSKSCISS